LQGWTSLTATDLVYTEESEKNEVSARIVRWESRV